MLAHSTLKAVRPSMPASLWLSGELEPGPLYLKALTGNLSHRCPLPCAQASPAEAQRPGSMEGEAACLSWAAAAFRWQNKAGFAAWLLSCHIIFLPVPTCPASEPQPAPSTRARKTDRAPLPGAPAPPPREADLGTSSPGSGFCRLLTGARRGERAAGTARGDVQIHPEDSSCRIYSVLTWEIGLADAWSCWQGHGLTLGFSLYRFARANGLYRVFYPTGLCPQSLLDRHVSVCPGAIKCAEIFTYSNSSAQMPGTLNIYRQQFARVHLINGHWDGAGRAGGEGRRPDAFVRESL